MSDHAFKSKVRRQQKATGSSYMRARREVVNNSTSAGEVPTSADAAKMLSLMGIDRPVAESISSTWRECALPISADGPDVRWPMLRVPLGLQAGGEPVWLSLRDEAGGGNSPLGLVVGCTGSGKSVTLRTIIFGLCAQHSPEVVQLVMVSRFQDQSDGMFPVFADYPHTAAILGADDYVAALKDLMADRARALRAADAIAVRHDGDGFSIVDDGAVSWAYDGFSHVDAGMAQPGGADMGELMADAIERTVQERVAATQEPPPMVRFEPAGSIGRYNQARATDAGADLPPLPYIVVALDEEGMLTSDDPAGAQLRDALIRKGWDLGIHVLAARQTMRRIDPGSRQLFEKPSYRIVLRAQDIALSREAIGNDAAYQLPDTPGVGLFQPRRASDPVTFRGFRLRDDWVQDIGRQLAATG